MRRTATLLSLLVACSLATPAAAKDLGGMWGIGFTKAFAPSGSGLSSIVGRYWVDQQLAVEAQFGFELTNDDVDTRYFDLGGRFLIKMVEEDNLHVYGGAGLALLYEKIENDSDGGVGVEAFGGVEYFFQGLPNLGFTTEVGLGLDDLGDRTSFGTQGESFFNLGVRYYF